MCINVGIRRSRTRTASFHNVFQGFTPPEYVASSHSILPAHSLRRSLMAADVVGSSSISTELIGITQISSGRASGSVASNCATGGFSENSPSQYMSLPICTALNTSGRAADASTASTEIYPEQFGRVISVVKPRMTVAYHFYNEFDVEPEVHPPLTRLSSGPGRSAGFGP